MNDLTIERMRNLHTRIVEYLDQAQNDPVNIGLFRNDWQVILDALEIAGEM